MHAARRRRWRPIGLLVAGTLVCSCSASGGAAPGPRSEQRSPSTSPAEAATVSSPATVTARSGETATSGPRKPSTNTTAKATSTTAPATTTTTVPLRRADWAVFDLTMSQRLIGGGSQAASVAVAVDGKVVHRAAYGERVPGEPAEPSDRFRIASISKTFATAAAMRLVADDAVQLDDPVLQLIADHLGVGITDPRLQLVTLRQLLGHASGIGEYEFEMFYGGADSCEQAAMIALGEGVISQPGTRFRYSNMNYCLVGILVEALSGRPYQRVVRHEVLAPLGIAGMRTAGTRDVRERDVLHPASPDRNYMATLGAAGTWIATPTDVVRLADSLDSKSPGEHPVDAPLVAQMKRPSTPPERGAAPRQAWYGMGLMVWSDGSYGHTGTLENTHAMFLARPDGVTWAVLVSGENPSESAALRPIVDEALLRSLAQ